MAKLTKRQATVLRGVLMHARAAKMDIDRDDVVLTHVRSVALTTQDVVLADGRVVCPMAKYGRPYVRLGTAIETLEGFLDEYGADK